MRIQPVSAGESARNIDERLVRMAFGFVEARTSPDQPLAQAEPRTERAVPLNKSVPGQRGSSAVLIPGAEPLLGADLLAHRSLQATPDGIDCLWAVRVREPGFRHLAMMPQLLCDLSLKAHAWGSVTVG